MDQQTSKLTGADNGGLQQLLLLYREEEIGSNFEDRSHLHSLLLRTLANNSVKTTKADSL